MGREFDGLDEVAVDDNFLTVNFFYRNHKAALSATSIRLFSPKSDVGNCCARACAYRYSSSVSTVKLRSGRAHPSRGPRNAHRSASGFCFAYKVTCSRRVADVATESMNVRASRDRASPVTPVGRLLSMAYSAVPDAMASTTRSILSGSVNGLSAVTRTTISASQARAADTYRPSTSISLPRKLGIPRRSHSSMMALSD